MTGIVEDLRVETEAARFLLDSIRDVLEGDEELATDMVEGETNLHDAIRAGMKRLAELDALIDGIDGLSKNLKTRADRLDLQKDRLRTALAVAMEIGCLKKVEADIGTISLKATPPKVIRTNEADIPAKFWRPSDPKLDLKALGDALKNKEDVPGAELSNGGMTVQVKWS